MKTAKAKSEESLDNGESIFWAKNHSFVKFFNALRSNYEYTYSFHASSNYIDEFHEQAILKSDIIHTLYENLNDYPLFVVDDAIEIIPIEVTKDSVMVYDNFIYSNILEIINHLKAINSQEKIFLLRCISYSPESKNIYVKGKEIKRFKNIKCNAIRTYMTERRKRIINNLLN